MSPFKGQGANQGLIDAVQLAQCLARNPRNIDLPHALFEFEKEMIVRTEAKVAHSRDCAYRFHQQESLSTHFFADLRGLDNTIEVVNKCRREGIGAFPDRIPQLDEFLRARLRQ